MSTPKTPRVLMCYYYIQEGGSSTEGCYVHGFNQKRHAERSRASAIRAAYRCGEIIPVPRAVADAPGFAEFLAALVDSIP